MRSDSPTVTASSDTASKRPSIRQVFSELRAAGRIGLLPFIPAGYPDLRTTAQLVPALERGGASAIEIGIPFSDPIADGPVIQEAFTQALGSGIKVADVLSTVASTRGEVSVPLIAMVSYSIVFRYGLSRFLGEAREAGVDGLIIPDLPPPEAREVSEKVQAAGLDTILLVSPTTTAERRREIVRLSSGFVYYLSVTGITGERDRLPAGLEENLRQLREMSEVPVCVGFGISRPEHLAQLAGSADGAIVGSAFVRRISEHAAEGPEAAAAAAERYCRELLAQVR